MQCVGGFVWVAQSFISMEPQMLVLRLNLSIPHRTGKMELIRLFLRARWNHANKWMIYYQKMIQLNQIRPTATISTRTIIRPLTAERWSRISRSYTWLACQIVLEIGMRCKPPMTVKGPTNSPLNGKSQHNLSCQVRPDQTNLKIEPRSGNSRFVLPYSTRGRPYLRAF